jgi:uncharacterized protein YndB with AHSA1/START domain
MTLTSTTQDTVTQTHRIYLKATPEQVWDALTQSEWTTRYGYGGRIEIELRAGGAYRAFAAEAWVGPGVSVVVTDGEVLEAQPARRLALTWRMAGDEEMAAEGHTKLAYDIALDERGVTTLTVTHDVTGAPRTAALVAGEIPGTGGGWAFVLSDLKSLLETGSSVAA